MNEATTTLTRAVPVIGGGVDQLDHGPSRSMLWAKRERFMFLALELAPTHHRCGVCLARDEPEPGDVLRLVEDAECIWIWARAGFSVEAFEARVDQSHRTHEEI
jgi:hypothetical protein